MLLPDGGSGEQILVQADETPVQKVGVEAYGMSRNQISCPRAVSVQET